MFEPTDTPFPFWGSATTTKGGRDPLAVQNSSIVIYSNMVTGITNVTARVRYNGFFCWLLTLIAQRLQLADRTKVDDLSEQIRLVRRGELLLAYVMACHYPDVTGVSGSTYALNNITSDDLDLAKGADYENKGKNKIYWQNQYGIFGQYYIGVLTQLRLIFQPDAKHRTYRVTPEGFQLYESYQSCLTEQTEDLFWNAIYSGNITKEQLNELRSLAIHVVGSQAELEDYQRIFCTPDRIDTGEGGVCHRINSLKLMMRYIDGDGSSTERRDMVLSFLQYNFLHTLEKQLKVSSEELSWFLYELNELSHAAYEAFHFVILYKITSEPQPLEYVLEAIQQEFDKYKPNYSDTDDIYELYHRILDGHKTNDCGALVCNASYMLHKLNGIISVWTEQLCEFSLCEGYDITHPGYAPLLLPKLDKGEEMAGTWDHVENCIFFAINDHLKSSYSKSTIGQGLVHNYLVEDGLIWELRRPVPIRTSPRLQNALQYMEDMKWIGPEGNCYRVTERGFNILGQ